MQDRYFTDEELVSYLDGEADFAPVEEIAEALKIDSSLAKRLDALRLDTHLISDSFDPILPMAPAMPQLNSKARPSRPLVPVAAAVLVSLLLGYGFAQWTFAPEKPGWKKYVASYQALYTNSTLAGLKPQPDSQRGELQRVSAAIGKNIPIEALTRQPELTYKRSQILGFNGKALVQLAFLSSTGQPVALCIIRTKKDDSKSIQEAQLENMSSAAWTRDGYDYLLIGRVDQLLVSRLAQEFSNSI